MLWRIYSRNRKNCFVFEIITSVHTPMVYGPMVMDVMACPDVAHEQAAAARRPRAHGQIRLFASAGEFGKWFGLKKEKAALS